MNESNARLLNAIETASADIESAALRGKRYSATELSALQTNDDWTLKGATAALTMGHLYSARGSGIPTSISRKVRDAQALLVDLNKGKQVFNDSGAIDAGLPKASVISASTRKQLDMVSDSDYFPTRRDQTF